MEDTNEVLYETQNYCVYINPDEEQVLTTGDPANYCVENSGTGLVEFIASNLPHAISIARSLDAYMCNLEKEEQEVQTKQEVSDNVIPFH